MLALGLNVSGFITSAALAQDDTILAAVPEERLSRTKRDRAFPSRAIEACLREAHVRPEEVDVVVVAWNPAYHVRRDLRLMHEANRMRAKYLASVPNGLYPLLAGNAEGPTELQIFDRRILYLDHHLAHAASACFTSPWPRGAFATIDAFGEEDTLTLGRFGDGEIEILERIKFPHSVGAFYSYITEFLGFRADADEYKVMALAAYADAAHGEVLRERLARLYEVRSGRHFHFRLDLSRFDHYLFERPHDFGPLAEALGMPARRPSEPLTEDHFALAWALSRCFERIVHATLAHTRAITGERHVALAGGCFMNSVANGKLLEAGGPFEDVHIPPYPDDSGTAIGAALHATLHGRGFRHRAYRHNYFGPAISAAAAARALTYRKIPFSRVPNLPDTVAQAVASGDIVAVAMGRMEFGQRALGNRSILADPRDPDVRKKLNDSVKGREWFRPYGASVLAEHAAEVFDLPPGFRADFMERVRMVRPEWVERIRGVLHHDGSVRLHLVEREANPAFYAIIEAFYARTGVPLLVNTSFNVSRTPIVCAEEDALECFFECGLDGLFLEDVCVYKPAPPPADAGSAEESE